MTPVINTTYSIYLSFCIISYRNKETCNDDAKWKRHPSYKGNSSDKALQCHNSITQTITIYFHIGMYDPPAEGACSDIGAIDARCQRHVYCTIKRLNCNTESKYKHLKRDSEGNILYRYVGMLHGQQGDGNLHIVHVDFPCINSNHKGNSKIFIRFIKGIKFL